MNQIAELEEREREIRTELYRLRGIETQERNRSLVGRCFKYRNSYSCPEKPSDYWWMYTKVMKLKGANIICWQFQTDRDGKIEIEFARSYYNHMVGDQVEISESEFNKAWRSIQKKIASR